MNPRELAMDTLERFIRDGLGGEFYPRAIAAECLTALEGQGWRPTGAKPPPLVLRSPGGGAEPPEEWRKNLEAIRAMPPLPEHRSESGGAA